MNLRTGALALAAAAFLLAGTGCANNKLTAERDSLANQNRELADQLKAEREARQLAETRASVMNGQMAALPDTSLGGGPLDLTNPRPIGRTPTPVIRNTTPATPRPVATKVTLPGNVLFASGKVTLDAAATKELNTMAATIKSKYKGDKLVIEGFADNTPLSKTSVWVSNADLAKARATAVKNYLVKQGIPAADITVKGTTTTATGAAARKAEVQVNG